MSGADLCAIVRSALAAEEIAEGQRFELSATWPKKEDYPGTMDHGVFASVEEAATWLREAPETLQASPAKRLMGPREDLKDLAMRGALPTPAELLAQSRLMEVAEPAEAKRPGKAEPKGPRLVVTWLSEVEPEPVEWLWEPCLPKGEIVLLAGDGKVGKSTIAAMIATAVTLGEPLEDVSEPGKFHPRRTPRAVVFLSSEDSVPKIVQPRFARLGADLSRLALPRLEDADGAPMAITLDQIALVEELLDRVRPALLVVDPIQSYLGAGVDAHRTNEVRPILDGLGELAARFGCTVLVLAHFTKDSKTDPVARIQGSADFVNRARSVLIAGKAPDGTRALVHERCNMAPEGPGITYELGGEAGFAWGELTTLTARDLYQPKGPKPVSKADAARTWLELFLEDGPRRQADVKAACKAEGIAWGTLQRARRDLGVEPANDPAPGKRGSGGSWWRLTDDQSWPWECTGASDSAAQGSRPAQVKVWPNSTSKGVAGD